MPESGTPVLSINGKQSVDDIHKKLGHIMWENVGMARSKESLEKAIVEIQALRKEFWKDVKVVGKANEFNVELEKALRRARRSITDTTSTPPSSTRCSSARRACWTTASSWRTGA